MSATLIQTQTIQDYQSAGANFVVTMASATTSGNTLIGSFGADGDAASTVTDNGGNTWTKIASTTDIGAVGQRRGQLWYCVNANSVTEVYISSSIGQNVLASVSEWQGITGLRGYNAANAQSGATTTTAQTGDLVFAPCYYYRSSGSPELTPESGWQSAGSIVRGSNYHSTAYQTAPSDGAHGPLWDISAAGKATITAAFTTKSDFDSSNVHVRVNGGWKKAISHIRVDGAWVPSSRGDDTDSDPNPGDDELAGWKMLYSTEFETDDGLWTARQETQANDNSYNHPDNIVYGAEGLKVLGIREDRGGRPFTTGDLTGMGVVVPNYFRAEVTATLPTEPGMWPAPLWFRPLDSPHGEIDVCETWPYDWPNRGGPDFSVALHRDYSLSPRQVNASLKYDMLPNPDPAAPHTYVVIKTQNRIEFLCDGVRVYCYEGNTPWDPVRRIGELPEWYATYFEVPGRTWYPRVTLQIGGDGNVDPDPSWQQSELVVHSLKIYEQE